MTSPFDAFLDIEAEGNVEIEERGGKDERGYWQSTTLLAEKIDNLALTAAVGISIVLGWRLSSMLAPVKELSDFSERLAAGDAEALHRPGDLVAVEVLDERARRGLAGRLPVAGGEHSDRVLQTGREP